MSSPELISPDAALQLVLEHSRPLDGFDEIPIEAACGWALWQDVTADRDIPPFNKVCMDGFAYLHEGIEPGSELNIVGEVRAGYQAEQSVEAGQCIRVMTGAPLPAGADTVIPIECTEVAGDRVTLLEPPVAKRHVAVRGTDCQRDQTVLAAGSVLTPTGVAVLATVGLETVRVKRRPAIAILATGDEIVRPTAPVGPNQIRDSNSYSMAAQARMAGFDQIEMGHAVDDKDALTQLLEEALRADVVVMSGGVSMGEYDLVPAILAELGVTCHFHEVAQKPAKPLWFGSSPSTLVFGAPGNPLATVLSFDRYVLPSLRAKAGLPTGRQHLVGRLTDHVRPKKGGRHTFFFARVTGTAGGGFQLQPLSRTGAADVFGTSHANAIFSVEPNGSADAGSDIQFVMLGDFAAV